MSDDPNTHDDSAVIGEAAALIAAQSGSDIHQATRALADDAAAFGLPVAAVAADVVDVARAGERANPATVADLLATTTPSLTRDRSDRT